MALRILECGCCGSYHKTDYFGECRNDAERFATEDEALERLGVDTVEVERFEYEDGEVTEHFVETWPGCNFVAAFAVVPEFPE